MPKLIENFSSCRLFGRPGTAYDFRGVDVHALREKARELEGTQKAMKKKVNPKAISHSMTAISSNEDVRTNGNKQMGDREESLPTSCIDGLEERDDERDGERDEDADEEGDDHE